MSKRNWNHPIEIGRNFSISPEFLNTYVRDNLNYLYEIIENKPTTNSFALIAQVKDNANITSTSEFDEGGGRQRATEVLLPFNTIISDPNDLIVDLGGSDGKVRLVRGNYILTFLTPTNNDKISEIRYYVRVWENGTITRSKRDFRYTIRGNRTSATFYYNTDGSSGYRFQFLVDMYSGTRKGIMGTKYGERYNIGSLCVIRSYFR